jgi:hypothetical protein
VASSHPGGLLPAVVPKGLAVEPVESADPHRFTRQLDDCVFGATGAGQMYVMPFVDYGSTRVDCNEGEQLSASFKVYVEQPDWYPPRGVPQMVCWPRLRWDEIICDRGTRASARIDLVAASTETSIRRLLLDSNTKLGVHAVKTRMLRIIELAPLSLREWAEVFGVSHGAITKWRSSEPDRPEIALVLEMLERAVREHGELAQWLRQPLASTSVTPLQLLSQQRWRAFLGAIKTASAPAPDLARETLERLRRERLPWAVPDAPGLPAEA